MKTMKMKDMMRAMAGPTNWSRTSARGDLRARAADALDDAADQHLFEAVGGHRHHRAEAEDRQAQEDRLLAPDRIGKRAEEDFAEDHAEDEEDDDELGVARVGHRQRRAEIAQRRQDGVDGERGQRGRQR
jgi:hypothetical protein